MRRVPQLIRRLNERASISVVVGRRQERKKLALGWHSFQIRIRAVMASFVMFMKGVGVKQKTDPDFSKSEQLNHKYIILVNYTINDEASAKMLCTMYSGYEPCINFRNQPCFGINLGCKIIVCYFL